MKKCNNLIVIENGELKTYMLDDKQSWEVGRSSRENIPDIKLHSATVSRRHGKFQNMDGIWFYVDYYGKNGTVYNNKKITTGIHGRVKPIHLSNGDILIFGGGEKAVINSKTIWALFSTRDIGGEWNAVDTKGYTEFHFISGDKKINLDHMTKGEVLEEEEGIAIYMGNITFLSEKMKLSGN